MTDPNPQVPWPTADQVAPVPDVPLPSVPSVPSVPDVPLPSVPSVPPALVQAAAPVATITPASTDRRSGDESVVATGVTATATGVHPIVGELAATQAEHATWLDGLQERIIRIEQQLGL